MDDSKKVNENLLPAKEDLFLQSTKHGIYY